MAHWKRILFLIVCTLIFILIGFYHQSSLGQWIDQNIYNVIFASESQWTTVGFKTATFIGEVGSMVVLTLLTVLLLVRYHYRVEALYLALTMILSGLANPILKHIFDRERPNIMRLIDISGLSFPSGHAMGSTAFFGSLCFIALRILKGQAKLWMSSLCVVMIGLICASRIYLGVHYPTDIMAGILGGLFFITLTQLILQKPLKLS
ncbi:phosphatidic acid phosphatase [Staphylococcus microti]|uniref:Phosphatidic acid phosphatase n=1 Tax=Staphylococcus microti TaxID=569857 RepID=A0A0D6XMB5_9STAP|nr:phosphatase PAP2 family protein [Staphylococcus microti]KIX89787.1 phosphatidic acid phosphatase [Staphylococcus microti]PNZ82091.1 phosphatase PAP2 family protein [Staphylococcus microti]SUM57662.1 phospholipid phosphatase [Staphylococcus microti]